VKKRLAESTEKQLIESRQRAEDRKRHGDRKKREKRAHRTRQTAPIQKFDWPSKRDRKDKNKHTLQAPSRFSLIVHPEETIEFLGTIRQLSHEGKDIVIDVSEVTELTHDAISALISLMKDEHLRVLGGNSPKDPKLAELWTRSGFYSYVKSSNPPRDAAYGDIRHRISKRVEGVTAKDLIKFATQSLYGVPRLDKTTYRTLLECMNNTRSHAAGALDGNPRPWWATVYCEPGTGVASFTFIDNGVGIFGSVSQNMQRTKKWALALGITSNAQILRDILYGRVPSSTGLPYRGKGLPMFYKDSQRGHLKNFTIIANDAYANVSKDEYKKLPKSYRGTCIYWEIAGELERKENGDDDSDKLPGLKLS
jgi:hypothetical protein